MNGWQLPTTISVAGQTFAIRSDFRAVLAACRALNAPDLDPTEQAAQIVATELRYNGGLQGTYRVREVQNAT